ncbi:2'-5' RNA ligase family protein [Nocardioides aurantiacus]|uniref:2'-5' RNA ligase superfamily protein n=1 Tax=Nocardioides aurantiacus TaxID=86796 RepID=A0A3N2CQV0_9ACTN|nr:2'-5' RNA ligase family protein [Nocardioides aurantiacus]ROR89776.1 2'-5' RNA ligase superfamily protein [Nocardioides aurantiacus]
MTDAPLIVTLLLDDPTQARFEAERRALFPAGRTAVGAHVTLFHALPAALRADVEEVLGSAADRAPLPVAVEEVRSLGRGAAYRLGCPPLVDLHAGWQERWSEHLTRQDAQPLSLHVTVQNKVDADQARATVERLRSGFEPWGCTGVALELWRYDGGPWTHLRRFDLRT